ncbi:MAG: leucine-rich repeat protein [Rikenellaceae bacterium]
MKTFLQRTLTLIFLALSCQISLAQNMSVASFTFEEKDMDARVNEPKYDQNGRKAALIKLESIEKGFFFDVGQLGVVAVVDKTAQTWVYVPHGVIRMEIQHAQLGTLKYEFPIAIKEASVYRMKLTSEKVLTIVEQSAGGHYLQLKVSPQDADASLIIDNDPARVITNGEIGVFLPFGEHTFTIESSLYKTVTQQINMANEAVVRSINLEANFGYLTINSTPSAKITLNGITIGNTPYTSDKLPLGQYNIVLSAPDHETLKETITLSVGGQTEGISRKLASFLSQVTISSIDPKAQIYVNNELKGTNNWIGMLLPGIYEVKASKAGCRSTVKSLTVQRDKTHVLNLDPPTPMYGTLNVNTSQLDVNVSIDGVQVGKAPNIFSNILEGSHTVRCSKQGYESYETQVSVQEGKVFTLNMPSLTPIKVTASTPSSTSSYTSSANSSAMQTNLPTKLFTKEIYEASGSPTVCTIPHGYTAIDKKAFYDSKVTKVYIPNSVVEIGEQAFMFCRGLKTIDLPNSVKTIGSQAFSYSKLESITLPNSVLHIKERAFSPCNQLSYISIPSSVLTIEGGAFCIDLDAKKGEPTVIINNRNFVYENGMLLNTAKTYLNSLVYTYGKLQIPNGVQVIEDYACWTTDKLVQVDISSSVKKINRFSFFLCKNLLSVHIPNNVKTLGYGAFYHSSREPKMIVEISKSSPIYSQVKRG